MAKALRKKLAAASARTNSHTAAIEARSKKGITTGDKGFRFPGSMNRKKLGA